MRRLQAGLSGGVLPAIAADIVAVGAIAILVRGHVEALLHGEREVTGVAVAALAGDGQEVEVGAFDLLHSLEHAPFLDDFIEGGSDKELDGGTEVATADTQRLGDVLGPDGGFLSDGGDNGVDDVIAGGGLTGARVEGRDGVLGFHSKFMFTCKCF